VLLEAMAAGMPVITTETCGMPDVVGHEFNGLLFPRQMRPQSGKQSCDLRVPVELRQRLGEAARRNDETTHLGTGSKTTRRTLSARSCRGARGCGRPAC